MADLFSTEETDLASKQGWGMHYIYDVQAKHWLFRALPHAFKPPVPNTHALVDILITRAKQLDGLALKALRLMAQPPTKEKA